jgi:hypothetical protein
MNEQIEPGEGWRLLRPDDVLRHGDEMLFYVDHKPYWMPTPDACFNQPVAKHFTYRRRIPAKPEAMEIKGESGLKGWMRKDNTLVLEQKDDSGGFECVLIWETKSIRQVIAWLQQVAEWREAQEAK